MRSFSDISVLHVFPACGANVNRNLWGNMLSVFPRSRFVLRIDTDFPSVNELIDNNVDWISKLPVKAFLGVLKSFDLPHLLPKWLRIRLMRRMSKFLPEFCLFSLLKLVLGPQRILVHREPFSFSTMVVLRFFNKKVVLIHWGGLPYGRMAGFRNRWRHKLCTKIFVLMQPEESYFTSVVGEYKVSTLPYPPSVSWLDIRPVDYTSNEVSRSILLGNNTYRRYLYPGILDRLNPGEWDNITCMLNYGLESQEQQTRDFIHKYRTRFGEKFIAWREVLPIKDYLEYMVRFPIYICPERTQSGLAAIYTSIRQGKAVLVRGDNYRFLSDMGITVTDLDTVNDFSQSSLFKLLPEEDVVSKNVSLLNQHVYVSPDSWGEKIGKVFGCKVKSGGIDE